MAPYHPILRPGISVSIGLDKNTKLIWAFRRFVDFCNGIGAGSSSGGKALRVTDLEFVHSQPLNGNDTAEWGALMKNDRILVRGDRSSEREAEAERNRIQREADRAFFQHMSRLMPNLRGSGAADVILHCVGGGTEREGRSQRTSEAILPAYSVIISKRCRWLSDIIHRGRAKAQEEANKRKSNEKKNNKTPDTAPSGAAKIEDDEGMQKKDDDMPQWEALAGAAKIEEEEDAGDNFEDAAAVRVEEDTPDVVSFSHHLWSRSESDLLVVTLPNHPPEAVEILLEYCYTNRVVALGHDAFIQACKTRPTKHQGPVAPYHAIHRSRGKRWPCNGNPTVTLQVALAAISLAEEAVMPRLSLMCEVSASQLLSSSNFMEALSKCAHQRAMSGNGLPRLRNAAMDYLLGYGSRGVAELSRSSLFRAALAEQRSVIIPTLLQGTMEAVASFPKSKGMKRDGVEVRYSSFEDLDREDGVQRENERRKRRQERPHKGADNRNEKVYESEVDDLNDPFFPCWADETAKRSLMRTSRHLAPISRRRTSRGSLSFPVGSRT